jgi:hypothetical protein
MLAYSLNKNIDAQKVFEDITNLINKTVEPNKNYVLVIRLQEINLDNHDLIPKIEYKNGSNNG